MGYPSGAKLNINAGKRVKCNEILFTSSSNKVVEKYSIERASRVHVVSGEYVRAGELLFTEGFLKRVFSKNKGVVDINGKELRIYDSVEGLDIKAGFNGKILSVDEFSKLLTVEINAAAMRIPVIFGKEESSGILGKDFAVIDIDDLNKGENFRCNFDNVIVLTKNFKNIDALINVMKSRCLGSVIVFSATSPIIRQCKELLDKSMGDRIFVKNGFIINSKWVSNNKDSLYTKLREGSIILFYQSTTKSFHKGKVVSIGDVHVDAVADGKVFKKIHLLNIWKI